ncbi:MAG: DUF58 domain-containing protein [Pseudomonadales bacterium]
MLDAINNSLQIRYKKWIDRRIPPARSMTLDQRRIFIFPTLQGLCFLLLLLVMLVAAINYQNNMVFALVFLLSSVFIVAILHTFANLSGLIITAVRATPAFVGDNAEFELLVSRHGKQDYYDISLYWPESEVGSVTLRESSEQKIMLHLAAVQRGLLKPERLKVETFYPLGLLRAWTWIALDLDVLIYPQPISCELVSTAASNHAEGEVIPVVGSDDFYEFKDYQLGDSLKHIFWKGYAKGQRLQTKQFASYREQRLWLDWDSFGGDAEQRLSAICYWVLKLERNNDEYGVRLPGVEVSPAHGGHHQAQVLTVLALFNSKEGAYSNPDSHSSDSAYADSGEGR